MTNILKKNFIIWSLSILFALNFVFNLTFAQENFEIIDQATFGWKVAADVEKVGSQWWKVWDNYDTISKECTSDACLGNELASGIMTRDTLLRYAVKLVRWLSQVWLLVWALMIVYAGYLYSTEIFFSKSGEWKKAISNAIIWVLVISFSYAIMKLITSAFL
jgi:hypothetical protein